LRRVKKKNKGGGKAFESVVKESEVKWRKNHLKVLKSAVK
jgi:hypothetical protein